MAGIPNKLYTLQMTHNGQRLGFIKNNKSFIMAFPKLEHAIAVRRNVSSLTSIDMRVLKRNDDMDFVTTRIKKRISINETMPILEHINMTDLIHYPFTKNVGIIFNIELNHEDRDAFYFDGISMEPTNNIECFRSGLEFPS